MSAPPAPQLQVEHLTIAAARVRDPAGCLARRVPRRGAGARRRVRLGQDHAGARDDRVRQAWSAVRRRRGSARRSRTCSLCRKTTCGNSAARPSRYVPQDPATALNPARRIGSQLREVAHVPRARRRRAADRVTSSWPRSVSGACRTSSTRSHTSSREGNSSARDRDGVRVSARDIVLDEPRPVST